MYFALIPRLIKSLFFCTACFLVWPSFVFQGALHSHIEFFMPCVVKKAKQKLTHAGAVYYLLGTNKKEMYFVN